MYSASPGESWRLGAGPFVFAGKPPLLAGELEIHNLGQDKVRVRGITTTGGNDSGGQPVGGMDIVRTAARLLPGQRARVTGQLMVDPATPPGSYRTQLVCGEQRENAAIHVFANVATHVQPHPVTVSAAAGEQLSSVVIVTNRGNIAQPVPALLLLFLDELAWVNRSLISALRGASDQDGYQAYLDRAFREIRGSMLSPVRVTIDAGTGELGPGETTEAAIGLRLPAELERGRVYVGSASLAGGTLAFEITCTETRTRRRRAAE